MGTESRAAWLARIAAPMTLAALVAAAPAIPGQQGQIPTFRAESDYHLFSLQAKDRDGNPVPNLQASQFEVLEDGVPQKVTYFEWFFGGRAMYAATAPSAQRSTEGLIIPKRQQTTDTSGRIFIVFIDDLHFQHSDTPLVRQVMRQIRDTVLKDADLVGFVSSGYSSIETDLVHDYGHRRMDAAIEKTTGSALSYQEVIEAAETAEGPAGLRFNTHTAMKTVYGLLDQAIKVTDRRKALLYISGGYDFDPFKDARLKYEQDAYGTPPADDSGSGTLQTGDPQQEQPPLYTNPFTAQRQKFAEADLISEMGELIRTAVRSGVIFYTIDPRGLVAGAPINLSPLVSQMEFRDFVLTTTNTLMALGNETGGFCICNTNDYKTGLERIDSEMSDYYMIGYRSSNPDPLRIRRRVEVKVNVPGVELKYPPDYTLKRPSK